MQVSKHITSSEALARKKALYNHRKDNGLCTICGEGPPRPGRLTCQDCAKAQAARNKKFQRRITSALRKLHICLHCRTREAMKGRRVCGVCIELQIERQNARRNRWRLSGLCQRCGEPRDREDRAYCTPCRRKSNRYGTNYRQKKSLPPPGIAA